MKVIKELVIIFAGAIALISVLKLTGLLTNFTYLSQSAAIETGLLDASADKKEPIDFDFRFQIKDLEGNKFQFDQFKGKVIFLNLWATWCGPCRAEMPTIQSLYSSVAKDSIVFVMLSLDKDLQQQKVIKYISDKQYTFPVYMPSGYLTEQLSVPSIPTTFVINKQGKIVAKEIGTTNFNTDKFRAFLRQLKSEN